MAGGERADAGRGAWRRRRRTGLFGTVCQIRTAEAQERLRGKRGGDEVETDVAARDTGLEDYDALVIPGGFGPDRLRLDEGAVSLTRAFTESDKLIAAICHGPQLLIEADAVRGRRLTSWPSVRVDLINAGAQ